MLAVVPSAVAAIGGVLALQFLVRRLSVAGGTRPRRWHGCPAVRTPRRRPRRPTAPRSARARAPTLLADRGGRPPSFLALGRRRGRDRRARRAGGYALQAGTRAVTAIREIDHASRADDERDRAGVGGARHRGLAPGRSPRTPQFYRIDTALAVPAVDPSTWSLRIHGMVEQEVTLTWDELLALPLEESVTTLTCVSNEVGGDLIGNAVWLGYPIRELLARAEPTADADMVLSRSVDGFTASTPLEVLEDDRNAILAVGMNGEPLPRRARLPGAHGRAGALRLRLGHEVGGRSRGDAVRRGHRVLDRSRLERARARSSSPSRIDVPRAGQTLAAGPVTVAGVAWQQHVGIERGRGAGRRRPVAAGDPGDRDLGRHLGAVALRLGCPVGNATPLRVRATGADGEVQTSDVQGVVPDGATGLDERTVDVSLTGLLRHRRSRRAVDSARPLVGHGRHRTIAHPDRRLNQGPLRRPAMVFRLQRVPALRHFGTSVLRYFGTENYERNTSESAKWNTLEDRKETREREDRSNGPADGRLVTNWPTSCGVVEEVDRARGGGRLRRDAPPAPLAGRRRRERRRREARSRGQVRSRSRSAPERASRERRGSAVARSRGHGTE